VAARILTSAERGEASLVFADGLDYARVRVVESTRWPLLVEGLGARLERRPAAAHNAVTIGNTSYFTRHLETDPVHIATGRVGDMSWLIHELAHQWQFQRRGMRYLREALLAQLMLGSRAYEYTLSRQTRLASLNREQQAEVAKDYYLRVKQGADVAAWLPVIQEMRQS
jgi:hypothetical protein